MSKSTGLDEAVRLFKEYVEGNGDFDELDFKAWLIDEWLKQKFVERQTIKNGHNQKGWKV